MNAKLKREEYVRQVVEKTGWDYAYAEAQIKEAKERLSITYKMYVKCNLHEVPTEEQAAVVAAEKERIARVKAQKEARVRSVMAKTGWDYEFAEAQMTNAKKKVGISFKDYDNKNFFKISEEMQELEYKRILEEKEERNLKARAKKERAVRCVMEETGWSLEETKARIEEARSRTGCTVGEYYQYEFHKLTPAEQDDVFVADYSKKILARYNTKDKYFIKVVLYDKELTNNYFSEYIRRPWCVNTKVDFEGFCEIFKDTKRIIYKPIAGHKGEGITAFQLNEDNMKEVYETLKPLPAGVVESFIVQHPVLSEIAPSSVNTLRIVTVSSNTDCVTADGKHFDIAYAALKLGGGSDSIVDNFHSGGMVAGVDLATGEIVTNGADMANNVFVEHPLTKKKIKGTVVPFFKEALEMVTEACLTKKVEGYLGWDVAIMETGPALIEVNDRPGAVLLSTPYSAEGIGMKHVMAKYMYDEPESGIVRKVNGPSVNGTEDTEEVVLLEPIADNSILAEFELKKPDYDCIQRDVSKFDDISYTPERFARDGKWWKSKQNQNEDKISIMFAGDITCFNKQFEDAETEDGWDFNYEFAQVKPIFNQADLVVGNLETMIMPTAPYRIEKFVSEQQFHCNAPLEFLDAVRNAGFDVVTNANNHDMDTGAVGIGETIDNVERFGLIQTGTFKSSKPRYELLDVKGFKIAIVAFATEHNDKYCNLTSEGAEYLLNHYSKEKAESIIQDARANGAEIVFVCIHWGKEHKLVQNKEQETIANELIQLGYDCIIGSHPHVLQPFDLLQHGNETFPVFYSMGNFISHNANNAKARTVIACFDLRRSGDKIYIEPSYIPAITSKCYEGKKYVVLPLNEHPTDMRNVKNLGRIRDVIGNKISICKTVQVSEYIEDVLEPNAEKKVRVKPELNEDTEYPVKYDDGKFEYSIYKDYAVIDRFSVDASTLSYSIAAKVLGVPIKGIKEAALAENQIVKKINFTTGIEEISQDLCKNCIGLEGIQFGKKTKVISKEAFAGCINLSCVVTKNTTKEIGERAFYNCTNLRSVKIHKSVTQIADDAFEGCPNAVFYCEKDSYAEEFAKQHGYKIIYMKF